MSNSRSRKRTVGEAGQTIGSHARKRPLADDDASAVPLTDQSTPAVSSISSIRKRRSKVTVPRSSSTYGISEQAEIAAKVAKTSGIIGSGSNGRLKWEQYLARTEPLPAGLTFKEICSSYPNHLVGEVILEMADAGLSPSQILELMPADTRRDIEANIKHESGFIRCRITSARRMRSVSQDIEVATSAHRTASEDTTTNTTVGDQDYESYSHRRQKQYMFSDLQKAGARTFGHTNTVERNRQNSLAIMQPRLYDRNRLHGPSGADHTVFHAPFRWGQLGHLHQASLREDIASDVEEYSSPSYVLGHGRQGLLPPAYAFVEEHDPDRWSAPRLTDRAHTSASAQNESDPATDLFDSIGSTSQFLFPELPKRVVRQCRRDSVTLVGLEIGDLEFLITEEIRRHYETLMHIVTTEPQWSTMTIEDQQDELLRRWCTRMDMTSSALSQKENVWLGEKTDTGFLVHDSLRLGVAIQRAVIVRAILQTNPEVDLVYIEAGIEKLALKRTLRNLEELTLQWEEEEKLGPESPPRAELPKDHGGVQVTQEARQALKADYGPIGVKVLEATDELNTWALTRALQAAELEPDRDRDGGGSAANDPFAGKPLSVQVTCLIEPG